MFKYLIVLLMIFYISYCLRILIRYSNDCLLKILYICIFKFMIILWFIFDVGI